MSHEAPQPNAPTIVHVASAVTVGGLATRTSNARERDPATAAIPDLWSRFAAARSDASQDEDASVYAVYTDYASDVNGDYTLVIGYDVSTPPDTERRVTIPAGRYLEFASSGEMPGAVLAGWARVWSHFAAPGAPARSYEADFERYDRATPDTVRIYVGVKDRSA